MESDCSKCWYGDPLEEHCGMGMIVGTGECSHCVVGEPAMKPSSIPPELESRLRDAINSYFLHRSVMEEASTVQVRQTGPYSVEVSMYLYL